MAFRSTTINSTQMWRLKPFMRALHGGFGPSAQGVIDLLRTCSSCTFFSLDSNRVGPGPAVAGCACTSSVRTLRNALQRSEQRKPSCAICEQPTATVHSLQQHMRTKQLDMQFTC